MEISTSSNSPKSYDNLWESSLTDIGSFIPFVVTQEWPQFLKINFWPTHGKIVEKATWTVIGAGSVVREDKNSLLMLASHHKHGALTQEQSETVRMKLKTILGENISIAEVSKFKWKRVKK